MGRKQKIIPDIQATMDEVAVALLQPDHDKVQEVKKQTQKNKKTKGTTTKVKK